jgi:hypothetical protein
LTVFLWGRNTAFGLVGWSVACDLYVAASLFCTAAGTLPLLLI